VTDLPWTATRRFVFERARGCCEYCQTCEDNTGQALHVEHIDPQGGDDPDNLCLSCANCNLSKASATIALDPETNRVITSFHPRLQVSSDHFEWIDGGLRLAGKSTTGRATIIRLKINQ
jgi:5-methylcytosine-specific restriction endonuclease McrA